MLIIACLEHTIKLGGLSMTLSLLWPETAAWLVFQSTIHINDAFLKDLTYLKTRFVKVGLGFLLIPLS